MRMKKQLAGWMLASASTLAGAQQVYQPPGSNLAYGASSNSQTAVASMANPAGVATGLGKEDSMYRFGLLHGGAGYEIGDVGDLFNQVDSTQQKLSTAQTLPGGMTTTAEVAAYINANLINPVNSLLGAFQRDGSFTAFASASVPFTPFVVAQKAWGGGFALDANYSAIAGMTFLADPLAQVSDTDPAVAAALATGQYTLPPNDSTMLVKAAKVRQLSFTYGRSVYKAASTAGVDKADELNAGVRLKHYQVDLSRQAVKMSSSTGAQNTFDMTKDYVSNTAWGLDAGALWTSRNYRVGAWLSNLNTPKFSYNTIDTTGYVNASIAAQLNSDTVYEMKPQAQLEGALFTAEQDWIVNATMDANAVRDPIGREFQWTTLSAAYATDTWWIPGVRVGYRANRAGSQLRYTTAGLTLFRGLSLDVAWTPEKVTDNNGNSVARSMIVNLGWQLTF